MVLSRLTKITGPGVSTDTNWVGNNADFTGITTSGTSFNIGVTTIHSNLIEAHNIKSTGILTATGGSFSGNVTAVDGTFSGNVSIAGTLTYEDLTNIDSVGLITARDGIFLPDTKMAKFGNTAADPDLEIYHGGTASYISHSGTGNLFIHSNTVAIRKQNQQAYFVGINGQSKLYESGSERLVTTDKGITVGTGVTIETNGQANFAGITTVSSTDLFVKPPTVSSSRIKLGYAEQMKISVSSSNQNVIQSTAAYLQIASNNLLFARADTNLNMASFKAGQQCKLTYNYVDRIATSGIGATVYGQFDTTNLTIAGVSTFTGAIDANGDLDVDGHTNLDNVSIAGVTTMTGNLTINSTSNARAIILPDNKRIYFGDGEDFWIGSNGSNGEVSGSLWLYNHLHLYDNVRLRIGHGQDLELFHNGTDSYIDNNTGNLHLDSASNIIFETGSSTERLRIGSAGQIGIAGANYGTSGQALVSQGSGSSVAWQTITGTTINNNADNRIITGSGTANTLEGEANLTFETSTSGGTLTVAGTSEYQIKLKDSDTSGNGAETALAFTDSGNTVQGFVGYNYWGDGNIDLQNNNSGGSVCINTGGGNERLVVTSDGDIYGPSGGRKNWFDNGSFDCTYGGRKNNVSMDYGNHHAYGWVTDRFQSRNSVQWTRSTNVPTGKGFSYSTQTNGAG